MSFYAVKKGRQVGIYLTWNECKEQVSRYKGAEFKKFNTRQEAINFNTVDITKPVICNTYNHIDCIVYTDGACMYNGRTNAKAGIGVYFGPNDNRNISQSLDPNKFGKLTNNMAELTAIIAACKTLEKWGFWICDN